MIIEQDIKTIEEIKQLIEPMTEVGETGVSWKHVHMQDTLDKLVNNLRIASVSYHTASDEDKAEGYYTCECECGWWGSSKLLDGGGAIADTGDHFDCTCPVCGRPDPDEKYGS